MASLYVLVELEYIVKAEGSRIWELLTVAIAVSHGNFGETSVAGDGDLIILCSVRITLIPVWSKDKI